MTARGLYEALLIELNKVEAPSLLLEDYNYFLNKAIVEYVNRRYVLYDTSQQTTDDLQVLTDTVKFRGDVPADPITGTPAITYGEIINDEVQLPTNYFHLLNCMVEFEVEQAFKIYPVGSHIEHGARRLTAERVPIIEDNAFMKPEYRRPYYYIKNSFIPADPNAVPAVPYTDIIAPKLEIRAGNYSSALRITNITVDYLKTPAPILLTEEQRDDLTDTSQVLEFPEYVANEIIKSLVILVLENAGDERIQTHPQVNMSVPAQFSPSADVQTTPPGEKRVNLEQR
jgi:hypothetical protein